MKFSNPRCILGNGSNPRGIQLQSSKYMTPNFNSPKYICHAIPDNASKAALKLRDAYLLLQANASACVWNPITLDCISLEYNTYNGHVCIMVSFTDMNKHNHSFSIKYQEAGTAFCEYLFEGGLDALVASFRSYAEWLMLQLWQFEIDAELCRCDRGLIIPVSVNQAYDVLSKMLDIVTNNIKPIDWFLSKEPVWQFYRTYYDLCKILPLLQEEAEKGRWKDVKPENFRLIRNTDCALICLDYTDNSNYVMQFRVGMTKNGFAAERTDKFMDMFYRFDNHAQSESFCLYLDNENKEFSRIANIILEMPFSWKTILFHSDDGFYINTYREYAFQKYCLMLDCVLPFIDRYEATDIYIAPEVLEKKKELEKALSTDLEISKEQEPDLIFSRGHFIETPREEDSPEDCPF